MQNLSSLGVGIGYRPDFRLDLLNQKQDIDFLEITADHYLTSHPSKLMELEWLKEHFTLIPHAINLSLGSAEGLDEAYLVSLAELIEKVNPPYWSEHLAFTKVHGIEIGHLTPVPYTQEAVDVFCKNIETTRKFIKQPLILENITYQLELPSNEFSETEFITKVLESADIGLLLDVTNLYTNATNHHFDYKQFLAEIPLERVVQFHFTGGYWHDDILIDGHSHPTPAEVWEVMEYACNITPVKGMILERDENIPPLQKLAKELRQARAIFSKQITCP